MFKFSKKNGNNSKPQEEKKKKIRRKEGVVWDGQEGNVCQEALEEQHRFIAK